MSQTQNRTRILFFCLLLLPGLRVAAQVPVVGVPAKPAAKSLTPAQAMALVGGPALITLHVSGAPAPQVFDAVIQQAGLTPVNTGRLGLAAYQTVTLNLDHVPFWKAVPVLAEQTHIGFAENGSRSDQAILQPFYGGVNPLAGRVFEASPFFVVAGSARRSSMGSLTYTATGADATRDRQDLVVLLTLLVDPKIHLVPDTTRLTVLEATDEADKPLLGFLPADSDINTDSRYVVGIGVNLSPQAASRRIQRLRGVLHVTMVAKAETWEIADLTKGVGAAKTLATSEGPAQLSVVSAQPQDRGYRVSLTYQGPTLGLAFRPASALMFGALRLTDSQGMSVPGFSDSVRGSRNNQAAVEPTQTYTAEMSFPVRGTGTLTPPLKLSWALPTALAQVDIPFEFTDLPLP